MWAGHSASRLWSWEETLTHPIPPQCCPPVAPRQKPGCQKIQRTPAEVSPWGNQVWGWGEGWRTFSGRESLPASEIPARLWAMGGHRPPALLKAARAGGSGERAGLGWAVTKDTRSRWPPLDPAPIHCARDHHAPSPTCPCPLQSAGTTPSPPGSTCCALPCRACGSRLRPPSPAWRWEATCRQPACPGRWMGSPTAGTRRRSPKSTPTGPGARAATCPCPGPCGPMGRPSPAR